MRKLAYYLTLALIFSSSWENVVFLEGIGRISRLIGIVTAAVWLLAVLTTGELRRPRAFHVAVALFVTWSMASIAWTADVHATHERLKTFVQLLLLVVILWDVLRTSAQVEMAMQAYVLGGFVSIASVMANYLHSVTVMHQRFAAHGFNPNDFGLIVALGLPMAWYLALLGKHARRSRLLTALNLIYLPAALTGILLAASRGSLIATTPLLVLIAASFQRISLRPRALTWALVALFVATPLLLTPRESLQRLATLDDSIAAGDMNGRVDIWREGLQLVATRPWCGVGAGAFRHAATDARTVAHNVFVSVLAEVGLVGLLLFLVVLLLVAREAAGQPRWQAWLWATVLLIWLLGALVHTWEQRKQTWLVFSLVTVSAAAASRTRVGSTEIQHATRIQGSIA